MLRNTLSAALILIIALSGVPSAFASTLIDIEEYVPSYVTSNNTLPQVVGEESGNWMGAFTQSIPIQVPQGRAEMTPELALTYNNQSRDNLSPFGYGWSMEIPSIQRMNYSGVDNLYEDYKFISSMSGELVSESLVDDEHGNYLAEKEMGEFLLYEFDTSDTWTVTDKFGAVYTFGSSTDHRQDNPSDSTQIFKWLLEEVRDTNDNFITYTYTKDEGQVYPETITYTGHGSTAGPFSIDFTLEDRDDTLSSYMTGFRVQANYRVSTVTVTYDGNEVREYDLEYTAGTNGSRSLLESITESAQNADGLETTLEPTTFTYSGSEEIEWVDDSDYESPVFVWNSTDQLRSKGILFTDLNADNIVDVLISYHAGGSSGTQTAHIGNGSEWDEDSSYITPEFLYSKNLSDGDFGVRFADVNGDFCPDILHSDNGNYAVPDNDVYISDCEGNWNLDSTYLLPIYFNHGSCSGYPDKGASILDVNGDGLNDMVKSAYPNCGTTYDEVYINNADGTWPQETSYTIPRFMWDDYGYANLGTRFADVNNDGLVDIISSYDRGASSRPLMPSSEQAVYLNQGDEIGWSLASGYTVPVYFWSKDLSSGDNGVRIMDVNGDGFPDLMESEYASSSTNSVYINNGDGTGWTLDSDYELPTYFYSSGGHDTHLAVRLFDADGDGMQDIIKSGTRGYRGGSEDFDEFYINSGEKPDLLETITSSKGATTSVSYENTNQYKNTDGSAANPYVPFDLFVVSEIAVEDGLGGESTISYDYEGGEYHYEDARERRFAGFSSITKTEGEDRRIVTHYHQDEEPLFGKSYKTEIYDTDENLYQIHLTEWGTSDLGNDNTFVYQTDSIEMNYDGLSRHRDKATSYEYDEDNGNLLVVTEWGEVTASTDGSFTDMNSDDDRITTTQYAEDISGDELLRAYPSQITLTDSSGDTYSDTKYYYDEFGHEEVELGNLSAESYWLDTDSSWLTRHYETNSYGLVDRIQDPLRNSTQINYDSENLYPDAIRNELGYTTEYEYDYISGQLMSETNANGYTSETTYDGFGRVLSVSPPDPDTGASTQLIEVEYVDDAVPSYSITTTTVDGVDMESREYKDGLGRVIQAWSPAESGSNIMDTWYDELGRVSAQTLAYESSSTSYSGRDASQASKTYTYDPLGRPLTETSPVGTLSRDYEHWEETVTDPMGIEKTFTIDAHGQLIQVDEENDSSTYSTNYTYDSLGNLTSLTDAQANVRNFTYDTLNRITSQEDLHDPSVSVQAWTYTYDDNGNILTQTNPSSESIRWHYDELNRVLTEDWQADGSEEFIYTYDGAANGMGLLEAVHGDKFDFHYEYDAQGNIQIEYKEIEGQNFLSETSHDLLGRPSSIIYPHAAMEVDYLYNSAGQIESISRNGGESIIDNLDYSPLGQISLIEFANGVSTSNSYDPDEAYRLTSKITSNTDGNIQDLTYTYDANGNITEILDDSITATNKTLTYTYDDLNRLTEASSANFVDGDYSLTYEYDSIGNMTYKSDIGDITYEGIHPQAAMNVNGLEKHYDANGNMVFDGERDYHWNIKNQLIHGDPWTYEYDHTGQRIVSADGNRQNIYVSSLMELMDGMPMFYVFAGSVRVASFREGEMPSYYHQDHLGGTAVVTSESGDVTHTKDYYPYGSELLSEGDPHEGPTHSFTDKEFTEETGLYYFEARWMDPTIGSFVSLDPAQYDGRVVSLLADPQSFNAYTYSRNNPIVYVDPSGEFYNPVESIRLSIRSMLIPYYNQTNNYWTTTLLEHSLQSDPSGLHYNEGTNLTSMIRGSDVYQDQITSIEASIQNGEFHGKTTLDFESGDLHTSIGHINMLWDANMDSSGNYSLDIYMNDIYDFKHEAEYDNTVLDTVNNAANTLETVGIIKNYSITINMEETIKADGN